METKSLLSKRGEVDNKFETYVSHTLVQRGVFHKRHAEDASVMHPRAGGRAYPSGAEPPPWPLQLLWRGHAAPGGETDN